MTTRIGGAARELTIEAGSVTLRSGGVSSLLFDLLTEAEEQVDAVTAELRFDIPLLTERLVAVTRWLPRRNCRRSVRSYPAAADRIWPDRLWRRCAPQRC
jgi:hypothetical protein